MENKHTASDLAQMQALPLETKIRMTQYRIREWYEHWQGDVYVSWSGGKDSTVLKHIVDQMYDDVPSVFSNMGLEYPEIQKLVFDTKKGLYDCLRPNVVILYPEIRFDKVIELYGYPVISKETAECIYEAKKCIESGGKIYQYRLKKIKGEILDKEGNKSKYNQDHWAFLMDAPFKISHLCCNEMKKKPFKKYEHGTGRKPIIATMASESRLRKTKWIQQGCNSFTGAKPSSKPMSFWTEQDVLEYIVKYNVPLAECYGKIQPVGQSDGQMFIDGFHDKLCTSKMKRTGCMFCMFRGASGERAELIPDDERNTSKTVRLLYQQTRYRRGSGLYQRHQAGDHF